MLSNEKLRVVGNLKIVLTDSETGMVKDTREVKNLVVTEGLAYIASRMAGATKAVMSHMQLGNGTGVPQASDTENIFVTGGLTGATRKALTTSGGTVTGSSVEYSAQFGIGEAVGPITEAGIMNAETGACDLLCRTKFDVVNKGNSDTMIINWTVTLQAAP